MSKLKAFVLIALTVVAFSCVSRSYDFKSLFHETVTVQGSVYQFISVDSEFGQLNGIFSPKILYHTNIVDTDNKDLDKADLLITERTSLYIREGENLRQVSLETIGEAARIQANVYKSRQGFDYLQVTATKIVILNFRSNATNS